MKAAGAVATLLLAASAAAAGPSAFEIMQQVDARDDGDREESSLEMRLIDRAGRERVLRLRSFRLDADGATRTLLFFESPANVRHTGFLAYDYDDAGLDDDLWLYLPALRKTRRIASADQSGSFMGSDFSYADLGSIEIARYDYRLMGESDVDGAPVWQIEAIPNHPDEIKRTGYTRSILFVRRDNFVVVRAVHWLGRGRLKYLDVKELRRIDGIWVITEMHMTTRKGARTLHRTVMRSDDVRFGGALAPDLFTVRRLERGP